MATNLRLPPETERALRTESARSGRSQQQLIREALDRYLRLSDDAGPHTTAEALIASQLLLPARTPFRDVEPKLRLASGMTTGDLLARDDRV